MPSLANLEGDETFEASYLGEAAEVCQTRISDDELILVKGTKARTASSIILRGPNDFYCDEMERSVHDALCVVKVGKVFFCYLQSNVHSLPELLWIFYLLLFPLKHAIQFFNP